MSVPDGPTSPHGDACTDCGTPVTPGARFCRHCGSPLYPADAAGGADASAVPAADASSAEASSAEASPVDAPVAGARVPDVETTGELPRVGAGEVRRLPDPTGTLRTCPNCGAPNSQHRELCGRCGADLDTGTVPPRPEPRPVPAAVAPPVEDEPVGRRVAPWAVVAVAAVALVLAGAVVAGIGPFARGPGVPDAEFDPAAYAGTPDRIPLASIATATTLPASGGESYDAAQMVDDDPTTAWNSDGRTEGLEDGVGERIDLFLEEPAWVTRVVVRNGDHRDADAYAANARIQRAQLTLDGGLTLVLNLLDEGLTPQAVELRQPELTTTVRLEVLETFPGDTHPDLAVSDLELQGWVAEGRDVEVAEQRAELRRAAGQRS